MAGAHYYVSLYDASKSIANIWILIIYLINA